jgi:hypothetical protein
VQALDPLTTVLGTYVVQATLGDAFDRIDPDLGVEVIESDVTASGAIEGAACALQMGDWPDGAATTPTATGSPATVTNDGGTADDYTLDPVEPIRGELVIEETDLELPSSGVAFRLRRTYRSRVNYVGPFGPAWDHGYNQRLFNGDDTDLGASQPPPVTPASVDLPTVALPPDQVRSSSAGTACGPLIALSTGSGTTIQFRELSRAGGTIHYGSQAAHLRLVGTEVHGVITWTLSSPQGDMRHFDRYGRLARWVDTNGLGLTFAWTPSAALDFVADAEGRVIDFEYNASGRLERVSEPASELEATSLYDANGALEIAQRGDGRSERYEYDFDPSRQRGDWIPEGRLRAACETACAPTNAPACTGGGACDAAVAAAMSECLGSCEPCALECRASCPGACGAECTENARAVCPGMCASPDTQERLRDVCEDAYDALEPKYPFPWEGSPDPDE